MRAELDALPTSGEVMDVLLGYVAERFGLAGQGQRKLIVFFEQGEVRNHLWEFRGGKDIAVPAGE